MPEVVHRSPRVRPPAPARTVFDVPAIPAVEPPAKLQPVQLLVPVLGSLSILVYGVMARTPVLLVTGGIIALASLASPVVLHWTARRAQRAKAEARRGRYRSRLDGLASALTQAKAELRAVMADPHPSLEAPDDWLAAGRLWERRLDDHDFLDVRLGTSDVPTGFSMTRTFPSAEVDPDAELVAEADALEQAVRTLDDAALVLRLAENGVVAVVGERARALGLIRAIVLELALTCAPDDLRLLAAFPPTELPAWDWLKWLPHTAPALTRSPQPTTHRLLATSIDDLERILEAVVATRLRLLEERAWATSQQSFARAVLVLDRFDPLSELGLAGTLTQTLARAAEVGVTVLAVCDPGAPAPSDTTTVITLAGFDDRTGRDLSAVMRGPDPQTPPVSFAPLSVTIDEADRVARLLAPKRLVADALRGGRMDAARLADLLRTGLLRQVPDRPAEAPRERPRWPVLERGQLLRVPFGVTADGSPLELDLKESAEGGHGPHGLVIGAVGSGKSELLRTLVSGLAATHGPDDVELAFADFKGGLTFALLQEIPQCSGMITNLADDLTLVDRMKAALVGELERRQQRLRAAGTDVQKIGQYRALRREQPELPPLPFLVVVVDEFGEMLEARPDMLDVLLSIARTGRSLGIHLLLASQRLEAGRSRGLDSYLGYRICLRTYTAEDSITVLGSRAAADLPALPGHGYLRTGAGLIRFVAATVSNGRDQRSTSPVRRFVVAPGIHMPRAAETDEGIPPALGDPSPPGPDDGSDLALLVSEARRAADRARRPPLWLPPLPRPDEPDRLTLADPRLRVAAPTPAHGLPVPIGLVDLPAARRQPAMLLDPTTLDGHLLVVGAPKTGKSTALAAYAIHAARLHPASLLQFHVIDLGGGGLAPLAALPNVGAFTDGHDADAVRRILCELERLIDGQPRRLRRHGVTSLADWRERVATREIRGPAHTVLLLDQLVSFRERFADLDATFGRLVVEGPSAGVHVAVTSSRWAELPARRLEQISTRIELRLNDAMESQHGRAAATSVPRGVPGRGLATSGAVVQLAAPGEPGTPSDLPAAVRAAAELARSRWPDVAAPRLRRLADLTHGEWADARDEAARRRRLLIGVDESGADAVTVEPGAGIALLCYGDAGSGRSRFLGRLLAEAAALPDGVRPQIYVLDYLGALLDRAPDTRAVVAAAYGPQDATDVLGALTGEVLRRQAALATARRDRVPPRHGRPVWLVADDYELVHAAARAGLVSELANLVPYAARLGFGLVLNQAANGSGARADPLVRRLLETGPWHLRFAVESRLELLLSGTRGNPLPAGQAVLTRPGRPDMLLAVLAPVVEAIDAVEPAQPSDHAAAAAADEDDTRARCIRLVS